MEKKPYEIVTHETLFQGYFRVERFHIKHEMFDGGTSPVFSREVFNTTASAASILLFDPANDKLVFTEQFRAGPLAVGEDPWGLEIVAGRMDQGEKPEDTAKREALEETGCEATNIQRISSFFVSPGCVTERTTVFIGRVKAPVDGTICGVEEEGEHIRVRVLDAIEAISGLYAGRFRDASSVVAMHWFASHHTDIRSKWLMSESSAPII